MLSTSNSALAKGGASNENLNKMKHHIAELEQCAKAYFREIQCTMRQGPDYELKMRWNDWNYAKCALDRVTQDFSERLIKSHAQRPNLLEQQAAHKDHREALGTQSDRNDGDSHLGLPLEPPHNFVEKDRPEELWYEPSDNFSSTGTLMMVRPKPVLILNSASKVNASIAKKTGTNTTTVPKTIVSLTAPNVKAGVEPNPKVWVPPHLRVSPKTGATTPTPTKMVIKPESTEKTVVKPKPQPEKPETSKVLPHLYRGPTPGSKVWPHQRQAPITPPTTAPSPSSASSNRSPVSSSKSSAFGVLIDISDTPATNVFDTSTRNSATHGAADVWEALMQLTYDMTGPSNEQDTVPI
ncbi:hypothetical protein PG999_004790 [Apiospora kogelbergensis]|uniref:Uncharacterized protein n=1 Tax=Apiospora kogelbergensis TaxID=1337665 RepID=A0AAW0R081_9PEZI